MNSLAMANDFLYSTLPSTPAISKTVLKIQAENELKPTSVSQTLTFKLPKRGLISRMYLKVTMNTDDDVDTNDTSKSFGNQIVEEVALVARGRVLRRQYADGRHAQGSVADPEVKNECEFGILGIGNGVDSNYSIATQWRTASRRPINTAGNVSFIVPVMSEHIGWEIGDQLINCVDTLFSEQLHLRVRLSGTTATAYSTIRSDGGIYHEKCELVVEVLNTSDEDYRKYRNMNFPQSSNLKKLIESQNQEPTQSIAFTNGVSAPINIYTDGVCNQTNISVQESGATNLGLTHKVGGFKLRSAGRVIYEQKNHKNNEVTMVDQVAVNCISDDNSSFIIQWDELAEKKQNNFAGSVSYSELPNLTIELYLKDNTITGDRDVSMNHIKSQFEMTDSASGMLSVSERS
jgi:hypothetical protein